MYWKKNQNCILTCVEAVAAARKLDGSAESLTAVGAAQLALGSAGRARGGLAGRRTAEYQQKQEEK